MIKKITPATEIKDNIRQRKTFLSRTEKALIAKGIISLEDLGLFQGDIDE